MRYKSHLKFLMNNYTFCGRSAEKAPHYNIDFQPANKLIRRDSICSQCLKHAGDKYDHVLVEETVK